MQIEIRNHAFELLPQKAIYWLNTKTLLIGDLHLGKITHFRKEGIAIPSSAYANNFSRLDDLMKYTGARRIILLGDLFHNKHNEEWNKFEVWRQKYADVEMHIVLGNHDILPGKMFHANNIHMHDSLHEEDFLFTHHPVKSNDGKVVFCGHIHPVYCIKTRVKQYLKFSCFVVDKSQVILPSFGIFTGGYEMKAARERKVYIIVENRVIDVAC